MGDNYRAQHGTIATVDGEFTCKRLQLLPRPMLMPPNPAFAPIPRFCRIKALSGNMLFFFVMLPDHAAAPKSV
ncbi:S24/S26 family peptidase [Serratia liquefaciens]|uniref:hypothetical protein n=1 Tax=Serratia liquefaciens TaxID=614 RepID=UPI00390607BD